MDLTLILAKVQLLENIMNNSQDDPDISGDVNPKGPAGPIMRQGFGDYAVATLLRDIASTMHAPDLKKQLLATGKELAKTAGLTLANGYDEGDDWCPTHPHIHWPHRALDWFLDFKPSPDPWKLTPVMNDVMMAVVLRKLATLTTDAKASKAIAGVGESIVRSAATKLVDDYCGTPVHPRHVGPPRKQAAVA